MQKIHDYFIHKFDSRNRDKLSDSIIKLIIERPKRENVTSGRNLETDNEIEAE